MFRDGAGEYEINGQSCRLMDVQEPLSDSGIGREMHVIVGQGRLAAILESRPRTVVPLSRRPPASPSIESAKRRPSANRLSMQANLARLTDLTGELRRQLKPLGRQAEVARRAATVQADLRDARLRLAADDLVVRRADMAEQSALEDTIRAQQTQVATALDAASAELARREEALAQIEPAAHTAGQGWFRLSALAERVDATIRVASERGKHLATPTTVASGPDPDELEEQAVRAAELEAQLAAAVEQAGAALEEVKARLATAEEHATAVERAHAAAVAAVADRREGLARLEGEVANLRTRRFRRRRNRASDDGDRGRGRAGGEGPGRDGCGSRVGRRDGVGRAGLDEHHERCTAAAAAADERVETPAHRRA